MRLAILLTMLLAGCAAPVAIVPAEPAAVGPAVRTASSQVKSWGVTVRQWTLDAAGRVEHVSGAKPGVAPAQTLLDVRSFSLASDQRSALSTAVRAVERELSAPAACDERLTDGPYGTFAWTLDGGARELKWDGNCVAGRDARLSAAILAADRIVDNAAMRVPPVERRPMTEPGR